MFKEATTKSTVEIIDLNHKKQPQCRIMICQMNSEELDWENKGGLFILSYSDKITDKISYYLNIAKQKSVDLIIFPELSIPEKSIEKIRDWSKEHEAIAICGSHYHTTSNGYISRCPVVINGEVFFTEEIKPAPIEKSVIAGEGLNPGTKLLKFLNTQFGDLGILICSDYLDDELKKELKVNELDILCVPSFQKDSTVYYRRMSADCEDSRDGLYILFSNFNDKIYADGGSALFGQMDRIFTSKIFEKGFTDSIPESKIFQFNRDLEYSVLDISLQIKRPYVNRNIETEPNIRLISTSNDNNMNVANATFLKKISHNDDKYKWIDHYYVAPKEYPEIIDSLQSNNIVFIVGDPGIGKTYTAVQILKTYHDKGYEPIWFTGLDKEDRAVQSKMLNDFIPKDKQIVYFEDPFGKTAFEKRDSLYQVFGPLIEKLTEYDSKIIITSRKEIFEKFSQESLLEDEILKFKKELNVRNPSYHTDELKSIFDKLASHHCSWNNNKDFIDIVYSAIEDRKISTPLAIRDFVFVSKDVTSIKKLQNSLERRETSIVKAFAHEIKDSRTSTKILLYLVFFSGIKGHQVLSQIYLKVVDKLNSLGLKVEGYSFNIDLRTQLDYRIEQFGNIKSAYKLSHPFYEEALARLILKEPLSESIAKAITQEFSKIDLKMAYLIINRLVIKYPEVTLLLFKDLIEKDIDDDNLKTTLSQKLISIYHITKNIDFFDLAVRFYPLAKVVNDINNNVYESKLLSLKLNLIERYIKNSPTNFNSSITGKIDWDKIFSNRFSKSRSATALNHILHICYSIDPKSVLKYIDYQSVSAIQQTYFLLDKINRKRYYKLFKGTNVQRYLRIYRSQIDDLEQSGKRNSLREFRKVLYAEKIYRGKVFIDQGAEKAIRRFWTNLLPVGITKVEGDFEAGTIIGVFNTNNKLVAVGMTEYSSSDLDIIKEHSSNCFPELIGYFHSNSAIRAELLERLSFSKNINQKWKYVPTRKIKKYEID